MPDDAKRCAGCKHWGAEDQRENPVQGDDRKPCGRITDPPYGWSSGPLEKRPQVQAGPFVSDVEEYCATLYTPAEFSCSLWEAKA